MEAQSIRVPARNILLRDRDLFIEKFPENEHATLIVHWVNHTEALYTEQWKGVHNTRDTDTPNREALANKLFMVGPDLLNLKWLIWPPARMKNIQLL